MVASRLCNHFPEVCHRLLEISDAAPGCSPGRLSARCPCGIVSSTTSFPNASLCPEAFSMLSESQQAQVHFLNGDAETIPFPSELDAITCLSATAMDGTTSRDYLPRHILHSVKAAGSVPAALDRRTLRKSGNLTASACPTPTFLLYREWLQKDFDEGSTYGNKNGCCILTVPGMCWFICAKQGLTAYGRNFGPPPHSGSLAKNTVKFLLRMGRCPLPIIWCFWKPISHPPGVDQTLNNPARAQNSCRTSADTPQPQIPAPPDPVRKAQARCA